MQTPFFLVRKVFFHELDRHGIFKSAKKKQPAVFAAGCYINENIYSSLICFTKRICDVGIMLLPSSAFTLMKYTPCGRLLMLD